MYLLKDDYREYPWYVYCRLENPHKIKTIHSDERSNERGKVKVLALFAPTPWRASVFHLLYPSI